MLNAKVKKEVVENKKNASYIKFLKKVFSCFNDKFMPVEWFSKNQKLYILKYLPETF